MAAEARGRLPLVRLPEIARGREGHRLQPALRELLAVREGPIRALAIGPQAG